MKKEFAGSMMIGAKLLEQLANAVIDAGGKEEDLRRLETDGNLRKQIAELVMKGRKVVVPFQRDMTKEGWTLLEDVLFDGNQFIPDIVGFLKSGESCVNGDVMRARAREANASLGQRHAEYLLNHQELIPKGWQGKYYLVFPGTVWQNPDGGRYVPCLNWHDGQWYLMFGWLGSDWRDYDRLVSARE